MNSIFKNIGNNRIKNSVSKISAIICIICASSAVAVLVLLIVNSKTAREITSFSLYSSFLITFYIINSIYHFFPFHNKAKKVFYILSHVFFIMMIWGVYIPPCLISLKNGWGWSFFGIITGLCVLGITLRSVFVYRWRGFTETIYYLLLNWVWLIAISRISNAVGEYGAILYLTGFLLLTVSMVFYRLAMYESNKRYTLFLPLFYSLLIISNICHAVFMFRYVANIF
ncbi:PAQR family membrane homeostasis protein TrhA [Brachyspira alvinipulli]|uniref:PAQR family membrane homeostasis protein TrhA n=1 Tax=Brachyspira alvinipulli TaxID=84379 RepID=UPI000485A592|nr:hemolysin III family protein [Brachyspira alvinipulli]